MPAEGPPSLERKVVAAVARMHDLPGHVYLINRSECLGSREKQREKGMRIGHSCEEVKGTTKKTPHKMLEMSKAEQKLLVIFAIPLIVTKLK